MTPRPRMIEAHCKYHARTCRPGCQPTRRWLRPPGAV